MGVKLVVLAVATVLAFVQGRAQPDGGYAEPAARSTVGLTATAVLALRSAGVPVPDPARAYLQAHEQGLTPTEIELSVMAEAVTGGVSPGLLDSLRALERSSGAVGPAVNSTVWGMLALRQAGEPVSPQTVRFVARAQARSGGFPWARGLPPDTDDTAAAVQALVASGVHGTSIKRALAYLRTRQRPDGGFESSWAIQAFLAAGVKPPAAAFRFLQHMRRPDGSLRYSPRYATTPLWVSGQALPALARRSFPLR